MSEIKYSVLICISLIIAFTACKKKEPAAGADLPADFVVFYEKFHADSIYQIDHIRFPLEGMPTVSDNAVPTDFHWDMNDWVMHKPFTESNEFNRELTMVDSTIVIEKIRLKNNEYGMERRFAKFGNEWQLIYYAAMNKLVKNSDRPEDAASGH